MNLLKILKSRIRFITQILFAAFTNGYVEGFINGTIYKGNLKKICVPGLNCYSCPGALGSCPIGSLQAVLASRDYKFSFYIVGLLMAFGAICGRFVCGWLCPFGLVQDLLFKIPIKKLKNVPADKYLKYLKYLILVIFVIILPLTVVDIIGQGSPWFCKVICPSGTLFAGIPLVSLDVSLRSAIGFLFRWKLLILIIILSLSIIIYRPFCRYLCPLGAIYSFFNPISLYRYQIDETKCTKCQLCSQKCEMNIEVYKIPNSSECIRCGKCIKSCPNNAIKTTITPQADKLKVSK